MKKTNIRQIPDNENYEQFLARVKTRVIEEGDCWIFQQPPQEYGRGPSTVTYQDGKRKNVDIRRHLMKLAGKINNRAGRKYAMYICQDQRCVNPDHIRMATRSEVVAHSAKVSGYAKRPERRAKLYKHARERTSRLTDAQIIAIRQDDRSCRQIAPDYGVSFDTIWKIKGMRSHRHVGAGPFTGLLR